MNNERKEFATLIVQARAHLREAKLQIMAASPSTMDMYLPSPKSEEKPK